MIIDKLIAELRELSDGQFVEVVYAAMRGREERGSDPTTGVGSKLVLGKAVGGVAEGVSVWVVCPSPVSGHARPAVSEDGQCGRCGVLLSASVNEVICPICLTYNELT